MNEMGLISFLSGCKLMQGVGLIPLRALGSLAHPKGPKLPNNLQAGPSHIIFSCSWPLLIQSKVLWGPVWMSWP